MLTFDQPGADEPHWDNGIDCQSCHTLHHSGGVQLTSVEGNANLCMSCHNPAGFAQGKPFTNADRAAPGQSGTSHAWNAAADNPQYGAQTPLHEEMAKRIFDGEIVCSTCHNQHSQEFEPFLRISNFQNALCKECHVVRDVGSYRDSPDNLGSHPVGIPYPAADSLFFDHPRDSDLELIDPDRVECLTCHGVHFTDSGDANDGAGDGYLLNMQNDDELCQSCHVFTDHMGQGCRTCHQPHDPDRTNILLVKGEIETPNSGARPVVFTAESGMNSFADGDNQFDGVCEVCHTATNYHRNDGTGQPHNASVNCTQCHLHIKSFLPPPCVECHNQVQDNGDGIPAGGRRPIVAEFDLDSHHVQGDITDDDCKVCHDQATHMDGYVDLNDVDGGASYRAISFQDGPPARFCLNCHDSDGASALGGLQPFSDGQTVPNVSQFFTSGGHGKTAAFDLLLAQGPITDPMSGNEIPLYSENANPPANLKCANCHGIHGADNDPILKFANDQDNTLCRQCHPTATSETGYYLTAFNRTVDDYEDSRHKNLLCTQCHNPHGSGNPGMAREGLDQLCLNCHSDRSLFRDLMLDINYDHGNNRCSNCHNPHSTGNEPFLLANLNEEPNTVCTDAVGQDLPVLANPSLDLAFCFACHVDANTAGSHDPSRCFACHGWYDPNTVLGQACGMADVKEFIDFKIHDAGDAGAPVDLGFSGLCLDCHFCGGDCGVNSTGTPLANKDGKLGDNHPQGVNCEACHKPHENQTNYPPVIIANNDLMLDEHSVNRISRSELRVSDAESDPFDVVFTLRATPRHGELEINGSSLAKDERFTQADIDRGLLSYQHDGTETTSDHFDFDADDSNGGLIENARFSIGVTPVNDAPLLRTNNALRLDEDAGAALSRDELEIFDDDNPARDLVLTLVSVPANGKLSAQGHGTLDVGGAFTQVDVNEGRVIYQHDGGETTGDDFDFEFSDGQSSRAATTFEIIVEPVNDSPELALNETLQLDEGNLAGIDAEHLLVRDMDNSSDEIRFVLKELPENGTVLSRSRPLTSKNDYFTQADIATGSVSYRHDGGETTSDEFQFEVFDGDGGRLRKQNFYLEISPVNDIPEIVRSGALNSQEGTETLISANDLRVSDAESDADEVVFTVTEFPSNGKLKIDGTALDTEAAFSQDDINLGKLSYEHNGSETNSDALKYDVADGDGAQVAGNELAITIAPVNDLPVLARNKALTLDEGKARDLSDSRLHVTDVDNSPDELVFIITRAPAYGTLIHEQSGDLAQGGAFTQEDLDLDRIRYQHDGSETTRDHFDFDVNDGADGEIKDESFEIKINPVNDLPVLVKNSRTTLDEGDTKTISDSRLEITDAESDKDEIILTIETAPAEGVLVLNGAPLADGDSFTQENLDDNDLKYVHSGSEASSDEFEFTVSDGDGGIIPKTDYRFRIRPVNDAPVLVTNLGLTLDEGATAMVSAAAMAVEDVDNDPDDLDFRIESAPRHGALLRSGSQLDENDKFTQEDIDNQKISYRHDGSETTLDSLIFRVSDGNGGNIRDTVFRLTVTPINDAPQVLAPGPRIVPEDSALAVNGIQIQDDDAAGATVQLSATVTSGALSLVQTQDLTVTGAGSSDLVIQGRMSAINAALTASLVYRPAPDFDREDSIVLIADDLGNAGQGGARQDIVSIGVTVEPVNDAPQLTVNRGLMLDEAETKRITQSLLAVQDIDNSASEVVFTLVSPPAVGSLQRDGSELDLDQTFTQADIDDDDIRYRHDGSETTSDSFRFKISDGAGGIINTTVFEIEIEPVNDAPVVNAPPALDATEDTELAVPAISLSDDDAGLADLLFTAAVEHGSMSLPSASGVSVSGSGSHTLTVRGGVADLNAALDGTLTYQPDQHFAGGDALAISVDDLGSSGSGGARVTTATVDIAVAGVNDLPQLVTNAGLAIKEGDAEQIGAEHLEVSDVDNSSDEIIFSLVQTPVNGRLLKNGNQELAQGGAFTQRDIDLNRLSYAHDGGETTTDSFLFTIDDGAGGQIDERTFAIAVTLVNDAPRLAAPGPQTSDEDTSLPIPAITVSDNDAGANDLQVTASVSNGALSLTNTQSVAVSGSGTANLVITGTLVNLNSVLNNSLVYLPDANFDGTDAIALSVNDLGNSGSGGARTATKTIPLTLIPVNDGPVVAVNSGLDLDEGKTSTIGSADLEIADVDNSSSQLVFTIAGAPRNGAARLSGASLDVGDTFTQEDIDNTRLTYSHDGGETTSDSLVFTVSDGSGGAIDSTTFFVFVTLVNDAPRLAVPGPQTGTEDGEITIAAITMSDEDAGTGGMELIARADNGTLTLTNTQSVAVSGSGTANLVIAGTLSNLNQALDASLVYAPDADFEGSDAIELTINDRGNSGAGGEKTDGETIQLEISPVNDPPVLALNPGLFVDEDTTAFITGNELLVSDVDNGADELVYTVMAAPVHGWLLLDELTQLDSSATFTQEDIDILRLSYKHDGGETVLDSILFNFTDGLSVVVGDSIMYVTITPVNDPPRLVVPGAQSVAEEMVLDIPAISIIDPDAGQENVCLTCIADNGTLTLAAAQSVTVTGSGTANVTVTGTLANVNNALGAGLAYHGRIDFSGEDAVSLSVSDLGNTGAGGAKTDIETVAVTVSPTNDEPVLAANNGLTLDEGQTAAISNLDLRVTDVDNQADEITFTVTAQPANGALTSDGSPLNSGDTFSQNDIDSNRLRYAHDGSETTDDTVVFTVSDGAGGSIASTTFSITIAPRQRMAR